MENEISNNNTNSEQQKASLETQKIEAVEHLEKAKEELETSENAIFILGGGNVSCDEFSLPDTDFNRTFVMIEKVKETPSKYPRKAGTPIKQPL